MSKVPTMVAPAPTLVQIMGGCFTIVIPSCHPGTLGYPAVTPIHVPKAGLGLLHVRSECIYVTLWLICEDVSGNRLHGAVRKCS